MTTRADSTRLCMHTDHMTAVGIVHEPRGQEVVISSCFARLHISAITQEVLLHGTREEDLRDGLTDILELEPIAGGLLKGPDHRKPYPCVYPAYTILEVVFTAPCSTVSRH